MNEFVDMHVHSKFSIDGMSTMEDYCLIAVKSKFVCKLPSGITVDNYAARRAACSSAIRCS